MQKKHRVFIAINLPRDIKKVLARQQEKFPELPAKWTREDNLHVTLVFLGNVTEIELGEVVMAAKEVAGRYESFEIYLDKIGYGPDEKLPPRMLWASGQKSKELSVLKQDLQQAFVERINFKPDTKLFAPHVTLARISSFEWRKINPEERPEVSQDVDMMFSVESIDIMESEIRHGSPKFTIIESISLQ